MLRNTLLWASTNPFLAERLPRYRFVQKATKRFMPGERFDDVVGEALVELDGLLQHEADICEVRSSLERAIEVRHHLHDNQDRQGCDSKVEVGCQGDASVMLEREPDADEVHFEPALGPHEASRFA